MKYRIPRKLKKKIPSDTPYCYKILSHFEGGYNIKTCEFYDYIPAIDKPIHYKNEVDIKYPNYKIGWCNLINCEIDDQCKSCDSKMFDKKERYD